MITLCDLIPTGSQQDFTLVTTECVIDIAVGFDKINSSVSVTCGTMGYVNVATGKVLALQLLYSFVYI